METLLIYTFQKKIELGLRTANESVMLVLITKKQFFFVFKKLYPDMEAAKVTRSKDDKIINSQLVIIHRIERQILFLYCILI